MAIINRTRSKSIWIMPPGQVRRVHSTNGTTTITVGNSPQSIEVCKDVVGYYGDENQLELRKIRYHPTIVDGAGKNLVYSYGWENFQVVQPVGLNGAEHVPASNVSLSYLLTEALARGNPYSYPDVDLSNFIWELKEFPMLLRNVGNAYFFGRDRKWVDFLQEIRSTPIGVQFGWKPLISDLKQLFNTAEAVEKRLKKLERLDDEVSSARFTLLDEEFSDTLTGATGYVAFKRIRRTKVRCWGVLKHKLNGLPPFPRPLWDEAASASFTFDLSPATIWNSIPWSWLIDYLTNVGDILESQRRGKMLQYDPKSLLIMRNHKTVASVEVTGHSSSVSDWDVEISKGGGYVAESKLRNYQVNPTARLAFKPIITSGQLTNLAALLLANPFKTRIGR